MSLDAFRAALDDLTETAFCQGRCRLAERIAIALPDGDVDETAATKPAKQAVKRARSR